MTTRPAVLIASCVGGGPMARLATRLLAEGRPAEVTAQYTPETWRQRTSSGPVGRVRARLASMAVFPLRCLVLWTRTERGAVVVPTTNPPFLPLLAVVTRPLHRLPVVPLVYDLFPDAIEAQTGRAQTGLFARFMSAANRYWFAQADGLVFIGANMASAAMERYGTPRRHLVAQTGADPDEFTRLAPRGESALEDWCDGFGVLVTYVGNAGHVHDWDTMVRAVDDLAAAATDVGVVIAATGPGAEYFRSQLAGRRYVRFEPPLADEAWARLLARSDVSIVTLRPAGATSSVPSKAYSALAAGNALFAIVPSRSDIAELVERHSCGLRIEPGDHDAAASALKALTSDTVLRASLQDNARRAAREFSVEAMARRWDEFLDGVSAAVGRRSA